VLFRSPAYTKFVYFIVFITTSAELFPSIFNDLFIMNDIDTTFLILGNAI